MNATASALMSESWNPEWDGFQEQDLPPSKTRINIHMKEMLHEKTRPDDPGGFQSLHRTGYFFFRTTDFRFSSMAA